MIPAEVAPRFNRARIPCVFEGILYIPPPFHPTLQIRGWKNHVKIAFLHHGHQNPSYGDVNATEKATFDECVMIVWWLSYAELVILFLYIPLPKLTQYTKRSVPLTMIRTTRLSWIPKIHESRDSHNKLTRSRDSHNKANKDSNDKATKDSRDMADRDSQDKASNDGL